MSKHKKVLALHRANTPQQRFICPFPNCGKVYVKHEGKPDCCPDHQRFIADWLFVRSHLTLAARPSDLIVPGTKQYDLAVRNAIKKVE